MFTELFTRKTPVHVRDVYLYNTESKKKEVFTPLNDKEVKMYSCGPTVYDYAHIGNLRSYVFADIVKRVLIRNGYPVNHTINLTDFGHLTSDGDEGEDKMMKGLKRDGLPVTLDSMRQLSTRYIKAFENDIDELRIIHPASWARASDYIKKQISLIKTLEEKGFTYETSDGLYFDISQFPKYGRLGKINLKKLKSGARVEVNSEKKHPADFAVWKKGKLGWDSRWGKGFPGWHIECSAMAMDTLGKQIDIHTGGIDHIPVHHNAEIAQSEAVTGKTFAKYWIHNAFLSIDKTKISKSLGNTITMRNLMDRGFTGDDYRYWLLTAHYRSPIDFSWEALTSAKQALFRLKRYVYEDFKQKTATPSIEYLEKFDDRIADDFDTPGAIAVLWEMIKDSKLDDKTKCGTLMSMDEVLDIGLSDNLQEGTRSLGVIAVDDLSEEIQALIDEREVARIARNWDVADILREKIKLKGYELEDTAHGPKVKKANTE
ncbi:cysteine--tRNA ligase [Candidatus Kaiserbacteria bacterium]|nr:cysteine--tRNA ligase [Candidatus Kaiserbacteria bacterium]